MRMRTICQLIATAAVIVGAVVYLFVSTTGYLADRPLNLLPVLFSAVAVAALLADVRLGRRIGEPLSDGLLLGSLAAVLSALALIAVGSASMVADVYFIPVSYPRAEELALNISLVAFAAYFTGALALISAAFARRETRSA